MRVSKLFAPWTCAVAVLALLASCSGGPASVPAAPSPVRSSAFALLSTAPAPLAWRGVSLAGAEFGVDAYGNGALPGTFGQQYTWPTATEADYWIAKGATAFRVPFRVERLQHTALGPLDAADVHGADGWTMTAAVHAGAHRALP